MRFSERLSLIVSANLVNLEKLINLASQAKLKKKNEKKNEKMQRLVQT